MTVPLALSTGRHNVPRLVSTFIDLAASPQSVAATQKETAVVAKLLAELAIPKFIVVRGTTSDVDSIADVYDRGDEHMTAVAEHDLEPLFASMREQLPSLVA